HGEASSMSTLQMRGFEGIQPSLEGYEHSVLTACGQAAIADAVEEDIVYIRHVVAEWIGQQGCLLVESGVEERWIVGVDGDGHSRVVKGTEWVRRIVGVDAQAYVAGGADFERYVIFAQ